MTHEDTSGKECDSIEIFEPFSKMADQTKQEDLTKLYKSLRSGSGLLASIEGVGDVTVTFGSIGRARRKGKLQENLFVPSFVQILVSVRQLMENDIAKYFQSSNQHCRLGKHGKVLCHGSVEGRLFKLLDLMRSMAISKTINSLDLWHCRLGLLSMKNIIARFGESESKEVSKKIYNVLGFHPF